MPTKPPPRKSKNISSPGRKKLEALGVNLPVFPLSSAGSLPKQTELMELRYRVSKGIQQNSELDRKERLSTEVWVRQQEKIGIDILTDGEMNRGDMVQYFALKLAGFDEGGTVRCYGNRYYRKPAVKSKVEWKGPIISEMWKYAQRMTHRPIKAVLTGAYTLMDWSFNEFYDSRAALCSDIAAALRKEVNALTDLGAKIIQIDEMALGANPAEFPLIQNAIKEMVGGTKAYVIIRTGYGDLTPVWKDMQKLAADNFHLEMANSDFAFLPFLKKNPSSKDLTIGVVNCHDRAIETPKQIGENIRQVLKAVSPQQLWLSTDSGLRTRTIEEAIAKMTSLSQAAQKFRSR